MQPRAGQAPWPAAFTSTRTVAVGIAAASVMDFSDKAAIKLDLHHFE